MTRDAPDTDAPDTDTSAERHYRNWTVLAPLGLLATGLGASGVGQSTLLKGRGAPTWKWVAAGTASLVALNAGLCLFGDAIKHRPNHCFSDHAAPIALSLTVVANRVPIRQTDDGWETSVGGLTTALLPVLEEEGGMWVGMGEDPDLPERQEYPADDPDFLVRRVPLSSKELEGYYYGMANQILWPLSHYLIQHLNLDDQFIETYRQVNERFAEAVLAETETGDEDVIWIQDYHQMLSPNLIRQERPDATIGHFWHIPWPSAPTTSSSASTGSTTRKAFGRACWPSRSSWRRIPSTTAM